MKQTILLTLGLALSLASCSKKETTNTETTQQQPTSENSVSDILLAKEPKEAVSIFQLRQTGEVGDEVTFKGAVIGGKQVFVEGRAIMVVGDPSKITSCNLHPGDKCSTPWDVCCDDPEVIKASILTVQIVDGTGSPLKSNLKGIGGLKELSSVTITGKIAKGSSKKNMLINATGIYLHANK